MLLWKFMWNKIKWNQKFNSSIILTTSQVLNSHTWLVNYHSVLWHRYRTFPSSQIILLNSVAQCSYCHERLGRVGRMACLKLSKLCALVSCPGLFLLEAFHPTGHPSPLDGARVWSQGLWASPVRAGSVCVPHGKIGTSLSNRMMPSHLLVRIMKTGHYQKRKQAEPQCRATHPLYGTFHLPTWTRNMPERHSRHTEGKLLAAQGVEEWKSTKPGCCSLLTFWRLEWFPTEGAEVPPHFWPIRKPDRWRQHWERWVKGDRHALLVHEDPTALMRASTQQAGRLADFLLCHHQNLSMSK